MMGARFDNSDGETPCVICKRITAKGETVALVENEKLKLELQTCIDLRCMMQASNLKGMGG